MKRTSEELSLCVGAPDEVGSTWIMVDYAPDVTGDVIVRYGTGGQHDLKTVPADVILTADDRVMRYLPLAIALKVIAALSRMRQRYEDNLVLSRPIENPPPILSPNGDPAFLMGVELARGELPMPLGWIHNVAIRMWSPASFAGMRRNVLVDIGAPPGRDEGMPPKILEPGYPDVGRIGRLAIPLAHAQTFADSFTHVANTGEIRAFNMDGNIHRAET